MKEKTNDNNNYYKYFYFFLKLKNPLYHKFFMDKNQNQEKVQKTIKLGICAMEKKVYSKHMQNILNGIRQFTEITIIIFDESIIFGKSIEEWPIVEALIIFLVMDFLTIKVYNIFI